jgi:Putative sensor
MAQLRTRWRDPATRRDLAHLVFMYVPLLLMDTVAFALWLSFLAGITLPLWYWSIPQTFDNGQVAHGVSLGYLANGPDGPGGFGWWIGSLPSALLAAAVFLVLPLLCNYLVVLAAGVHGRIARALLGPFTDPLADAKQVLASPGPLG